MAAIEQLITSYNDSIPYVWTGLEVINSSISPANNTNWGYFYRKGIFDSPTYLPWGPGNPSASSTYNRTLYKKPDNELYSGPSTTANSYVCEYEEALKQPVSNLEQKCANLTSSSVLTLFVNDVCYVLNPVNKNYNDAKVSCNALSGYNGHLAHIRTMGELWVAEALRAAADVPYARIGIEKTNTSITDVYTGWYLTTPIDQPVLATFLPWATDGNDPGQYSMGIKGDYPKSFEMLVNTGTRPFICQYASVTTATTTTTTTTTTAGANCTVYSAWADWSTCSQSCDKGVRSREVMYNISESCNSSMTPAYQYESCTTGVQCKSSSTKMTTLKSECMSKAGSHYAYSSCYFLANISGTQADASDYCVTQGGQLASLFGEDLVSQLGSLFLQFSSVQAWIGLKYTGGKLKWMVDNAPHALFENIATPPTGSECYALVSDRSSPNEVENPRLSPMACSASLQQAICMKSDHIYSSYSVQGGKKVIEAESPESVTTEIDSSGCGARCSEIIGCVGFNFNPSDGSCIPTKVSPAMPSIIDGITSYTVQVESSWNFYERI
uniref:C-type lectin domain-containing protein n=1 Tax=Plectus sambesii TaxID=2011161 RepID=A0A914X379_9BILA